MTNKTKLKINRVVIKKSGKDAYNEEFHSGINIIRGENSTGKSTIMELISYGIGADIKRQHWKNEALTCDEIFIDLYLNTRRFLFKRPIEDEGSKPPIYMKEGNYEDDAKSLDGWHKYGYKKTENKVSFATRIFDLLGYKQHVTAEDDNLTVHQIFRLLYADQDTPASNIFRWEPLNYDKDSMRLAIGEFLFGFDDLSIHDLRQKRQIANKKFEKIDEELTSIYRILGKTNINASTKEINQEIQLLNNEILIIEEKIKNNRIESFNFSDEKLKAEAININKKISTTSSNIAKLENEIVSITYDIKESEDFLNSLEFRKSSITNAQATVNYLGLVDFEYCPSCLSRVTDSKKYSCCSLCKTEINASVINESYLQAIEQIDFQYKETSSLIETNKINNSRILARINVEINEINKLRSEFREINSFTDDFELNLTRFASEKGFIESQIQSLSDKLELAAEIDLKVDEKLRLQHILTKIDDELSRLEKNQYRRKNKVFSEISNSVINILSKDTGTEDRFSKAEKFDFDFAQNIMLLDNRANFSASSNVLLKNSFHLAVLLTACNDKDFRLPCFTMLDNIEDKGMTQDRSKNFQRIIVELCEKINTDFQVIMTTSMIDESLNNKKYGVGPYYNKGEHTLNL
ncbi:hypothetical protein [Shewanella baltica]|uniref:hypothetical protein n=1 Tax=Shewanella baltica TaxID=62322 RepID=UPI00217DA14F|nr:hypothetical protein [Shewanella baltica]MCS6122793.1 hypothetical protein [Shewanella baltica]